MNTVLVDTDPESRARAEQEYLATAQALARTVLSEHSVDVDRYARFPAESISALHAAGLLGAAVASDLGGAGCSLASLTAISRALGAGCGASMMVWAMHQVQIACLARHHGGVSVLTDALSSYLSGGTLVASITSEVGIGGGLRTSAAAVIESHGTAQVDKQAPTVSYGAHAGAFLVTARRHADAAANDQVAVLVDRDDAELVPTGPPWNPMGMRGTCSPAYTFRASVDRARILPVPFDEVAAATMVPLSHILWSAGWIGIAADAFRRAQVSVRTRTRASGGGIDARLARAGQMLGQLDATLADTTRRYEPIWCDPAAVEHCGGPGLTMHVNDLKILASTQTVQIVELALEVCGMAGYAEDGPRSVARHLRDLFSGRLMIGNERLAATNAQLSLLRRV